MPRLPRSYLRFYWLLLQLGLAFVAMPLGQAFVSAFFWSLPHSPVQTVTFVWTWLATVQLLNAVSMYVLDSRIRSPSLQFVFRVRRLAVVTLTLAVVLRAHLRGHLPHALRPSALDRPVRRRAGPSAPLSSLTSQLLSSSYVIVVYPLLMSQPVYRAMTWLLGGTRSLEEHVDVCVAASRTSLTPQARSVALRQDDCRRGIARLVHRLLDRPSFRP